MRSIALMTLVSAWTLLGCGGAQAQLPKEVQADILQSDIVSDIESRNFISAKRNISKYRKLGLEVPPTFLIIDAKVAIALREYIRAKRVLEEYFKKAGTKGGDYKTALQWYKEIRPLVEAKLKATKRIALKKNKGKRFRELTSTMRRYGQIGLGNGTVWSIAVSTKRIGCKISGVWRHYKSRTAVVLDVGLLAKRQIVIDFTKRKYTWSVTHKPSLSPSWCLTTMCFKSKSDAQRVANKFKSYRADYCSR